MTIYVDIDQTIAVTPLQKGKWNYPASLPKTSSIKKINQLYHEGHTIVYWTARGGSSGKDWTTLTETQLRKWGCKYSRIEKAVKPSFDLFIDDKTLRIDEI